MYIENDIYKFVEKYDYPIIIKARNGSFDGRGNKVIQNEDQLSSWLVDNRDILDKYYVEDFINFESELSICGAKNNGIISSYEPVKNLHKSNILIKTEYKVKKSKSLKCGLI